MKKKILIVDNCKIVTRLVQNFLQKENFEVETAGDGFVALDVIKDFRPDIIIIDLIMPKISGFKLCKIIRNNPDHKNVFIIILSAIAAEEEIDYISLGADACIAKGTAVEMKKNILAVLCRANQKIESKKVYGLENVHARQITQELLQERKYFQTVLENIADGVLFLTPQARIFSVNFRVARIFQTQEETLISSTFFDHFEDEQKTLIVKSFNALKNATVELGEDHSIRLHGKYLLLKFIPVITSELDSVVVLIEDITKRKIAEIELQKHKDSLEEIVEHRTRQLESLNKDLQEEIHERKRNQVELAHASNLLNNTFNTITDFISIHDKDMKIVKVNRELAEFVDKDVDELVGKHCYEIFHGAQEPWHECPHVKAVGSAEVITCEVIDPNIGIPLLVTCAPFFNEENELVGTVHVARDISDFKRIQSDKEKLICELQRALSKVKQLSGLLPICASCKKIRDDKGFWNQLEMYIRDHSEAEFSHSICPECVKKLYPDLSEDILNPTNKRRENRS